MASKIAPPDNPKDFAKLFSDKFIESYIAQGMSKQELWSHVCSMWEWSTNVHKGKSRARTAIGWNQFGHNWLKDKALNSSKRMDVIKDIGQQKNSSQAILMRVSASCPRMNVEQLRLVARFLSGLNEVQQNECFENVMTDNLPDHVKPAHFQKAAVAIRNRQANLNSANVHMIAHDDRDPEKLTNLYEKNGVTSIWELVELEKKKIKK